MPQRTKTFSADPATVSAVEGKLPEGNGAFVTAAVRSCLDLLIAEHEIVLNAGLKGRRTIENGPRRRRGCVDCADVGRYLSRKRLGVRHVEHIGAVRNEDIVARRNEVTGRVKRPDLWGIDNLDVVTVELPGDLADVVVTIKVAENSCGGRTSRPRRCRRRCRRGCGRCGRRGRHGGRRRRSWGHGTGWGRGAW